MVTNDIMDKIPVSLVTLWINYLLHSLVKGRKYEGTMLDLFGLMGQLQQFPQDEIGNTMFTYIDPAYTPYIYLCWDTVYSTRIYFATHT